MQCAAQNHDSPSCACTRRVLLHSMAALVAHYICTCKKLGNWVSSTQRRRKPGASSPLPRPTLKLKSE